MTISRLTQRKFAYTRKGASYLPYIDFLLTIGRATSSHLPFLIDSGSVYSYAPSHYLVGLEDDLPSGAAAVATNCEDLSGQPLDGIPVKIKLMLAADPKVALEETIFFRETLNYAVLGHESFLKSFPALFYGQERSLMLFNLK